MTTALDTHVDETDDQLGFELPEEATKLQLEYIPRLQIHPDPEQPRKTADADARAQIQTAGMLQPITVRFAPERDGTCNCCQRPWRDIVDKAEYMIIFGERRWRAAEGIMPEIPTIIRMDVTSEKRRLLTQLIENHGRKDLSPLEDARAFKRALDEDPDLSEHKLAKILGVARSTLRDRLSLIRNEAWVPLLEAGEITVSQAVEVARYADRCENDQQDAIKTMRTFAVVNVGADAKIADVEIAAFRSAIGIAYGESPEPVAPPAEPALAFSHDTSIGELPDAPEGDRTWCLQCERDIDPADPSTHGETCPFYVAPEAVLRAAEEKEDAENQRWIDAMVPAHDDRRDDDLPVGAIAEPGDGADAGGDADDDGGAAAVTYRCAECRYRVNSADPSMHSEDCSSYVPKDGQRSAGPNAGGDHVVATKVSGTESDGEPGGSPSSARGEAELDRRHLPLREAFVSKLRMMYATRTLNASLAEQVDGWVKGAIGWVTNVLKGAGGPKLQDEERAPLIDDQAFLERELAQRAEEKQDAGSAEPAHQGSDSPEEETRQPGTAPTSSVDGTDSSEAPASVDASASGGRREAGLPDPSTAPPKKSAAPAAPKLDLPPGRVERVDAPTGSISGFFLSIAEYLGASRSGMITVGAAKAAGEYRVNVIVTDKARAKDVKPVTVEGTADQIDVDLPAAIAVALGGKIAPANRASKPAETKAAAAPSAPAKAKRSASKKPAAPAAKKPNPYKPVFPKKSAAKKAVAKKPVPKKVAPKKAPVPKKPSGLYPSALLAAVIGSSAPTTWPKALKSALGYAKSHSLVGSGSLRNAITADDTLRPLFGSKTIVTTGEFKQMVYKQLTKSPPATAQSAPPPRSESGFDATGLDDDEVTDLLDG